MVRIIAGEFRGRRLNAPAGDATRPTTDRVRESLMSAVSSARDGFDDAIVLDVFAGSGALGLEALSRGAAFAQFCDRSKDAQAVIKSNIEACKVADRTRLYAGDVTQHVPAARAGAYTLVFLDPPYAMDAHEALGVVHQAAQSGLLSDDVLIIYEQKLGNEEAADKAAAAYGLQLLRRKKYGDTLVDMYERG